METEKNNQSIINFGFVIAGFMAFYIVNVALDVLAGAFGAVARFRDIELVKHGVPVGAGILVFLILLTNVKVKVWADESVSEVRKVVWPSRKDTTAMTIVCCVMVVMAGVGFGVFDFFASQLIKVFVK
jgi:preprotein translocase subunit SecE